MSEVIKQLRNRTALSRLNMAECDKVFEVLNELGYGQGDGPSEEVISRINKIADETAAMVAKED